MYIQNLFTLYNQSLYKVFLCVCTREAMEFRREDVSSPCQHYRVWCLGVR